MDLNGVHQEVSTVATSTVHPATKKHEPSMTTMTLEYYLQKTKYFIQYHTNTYSTCSSAAGWNELSTHSWAFFPCSLDWKWTTWRASLFQDSAWQLGSLQDGSGSGQNLSDCGLGHPELVPVDLEENFGLPKFNCCPPVAFLSFVLSICMVKKRCE